MRPRLPGGVLVVALAATATACAGTPTEPQPRAATSSAAPTSATPGTPGTKGTTGTTGAEPDEQGEQLSGARAEVPAAVIMQQLARRAERIAKRIPMEEPTPVDVDPGTNRGLGYQLLVEFGFPAEQWRYLDALWMRESGWNHLAENPSSGAYGIPQSLPANKMAVVGDDWRTNPETQISWGLAYIAARYGNPQKAWAHSERHGWY